MDIATLSNLSELLTLGLEVSVKFMFILFLVLMFIFGLFVVIDLILDFIKGSRKSRKEDTK